MVTLVYVYKLYNPFPVLPQDLVAGYVCQCPAGYTGEFCSEDIDECLEATCPGNSTCVQEAVGSFECHCNDGFEGENCTGKNTTVLVHRAIYNFPYNV